MAPKSDHVVVKKQKVFAATEKAIMIANQSYATSDPRMKKSASWIPRQFLGPKNQLEEIGDTGILHIPLWVAEQEELIAEP